MPRDGGRRLVGRTGHARDQAPFHDVPALRARGVRIDGRRRQELVAASRTTASPPLHHPRVPDAATRRFPTKPLPGSNATLRDRPRDCRHAAPTAPPHPSSPRRSGSARSGRPRSSPSPTPHVPRRGRARSSRPSSTRSTTPAAGSGTDSELARLNASPGRWTGVSRLFLAALEVGLDAARTTDGLVDPTIGRALRVLGYDRDFGERRADRCAAAGTGRADRGLAGDRRRPRPAGASACPVASSSTSARPPRPSRPTAPRQRSPPRPASASS